MRKGFLLGSGQVVKKTEETKKAEEKKVDKTKELEAAIEVRKFEA